MPDVWVGLPVCVDWVPVCVVYGCTCTCVQKYTDVYCVCMGVVVPVCGGMVCLCV